MVLGNILGVLLIVAWVIVGFLATVKYWKENGGFHFGWWQEIIFDDMSLGYKFDKDFLLARLKKMAFVFLTLLPFGIFEAVLLTFKAMLFVASIIGGAGVPSRPRRNTDSLGRNYTDPYNQGRIDAANGASPLNPGDSNYMAGYNNNKK